MSRFFHHSAPTDSPVSSGRVKADRSAAPPLSRRLLLWLTYGTAGIALFAIIYLLEGVTRPGYNPWRQTISSLVDGPTGWIQHLNFVLCGVSVLWSAFVFRKIIIGGVCATWYPILRVIEGVGLVAIAIFSLDPMHTFLQVVIVQAMSIGLFVIARRFWGNPNWRGWVAFSVICGFVPWIFMPIFGVALNAHSALNGYAGIFERLGVSADTVWSLVLVARLWIRRPIGF